MSWENWCLLSFWDSDNQFSKIFFCHSTTILSSVYSGNTSIVPRSNDYFEWTFEHSSQVYNYYQNTAQHPTYLATNRVKKKFYQFVISEGVVGKKKKICAIFKKVYQMYKEKKMACGTFLLYFSIATEILTVFYFLLL